MDNLMIDCPFDKGDVYVYGASAKVGVTSVVEAMRAKGVTIHDMGYAPYELTGNNQVILVYAKWENIRKTWFTTGDDVIFIDTTQLKFSDEYWKLVQQNTAMLNELMTLLPSDNAIRLERELLIKGAE